VADNQAEKRLLNAILRRAVADIIAYADARDPRNKRLAEEAWGWIHSGDKIAHLTSFAGLCFALDVDPGAVRRRLASFLTPAASALEPVSPAPEASAAKGA
jgi:hypothetical protein